MTSVPVEMTAIAISAPGGPEVLQPTTRPVPQPGPGEALIRVAAAGVNRPDVLQRMGFYPPPPGASDLPGLEIAGTIVAVGPGGDPELLGQTVCALVAGGGYAEYCTAPAGHCLPIPSGLSVVEAAALPETFFTVWANVFDRARLAPGESILIHGGSSGIGSTTIQLAKVFGAGKIIVTCGDQTKIDYALKLGADVGINYRTEDFVEATKAATNGRGADVVLDMVGAPYFQKNIAACATEGRITQIAFQQGPKAEMNMLDLMMRRLTWTGSTLRARPKSAKAAIANALLANVWPKFATHLDTLRPNVHAKFALNDIAKAHEMMEAGTHFGKIVLVV